MIKVTWRQAEDFCDKLAYLHLTEHFTGVYGPARGGLPLAVWISHKANIPLLAAPTPGCLIVDDIADTGATLQKYADKPEYFVATLYYHRQCTFTPRFWLFEKLDEWIVFPWEE